MTGQHPEQRCFQGVPLAELLFNESGDALLIVDPVTERMLDANAMAQRLTELDRSDLLQLPIRSLIRHEQQWQDWLVPAQETTTFHGRDGFLLRTRRADTWVPVSVTISRLHIQEDSAVALFALHDRREAVEAHRRLQKVESELRRVLVSVSDCLWSCRIEPDGRWRYRYLSPVVQRLTGRSVGLFLEDQRAWQQAIEAEDVPRWRSFVQRLTAGYSGELEYRLRRPDGTCLWVRENVVAAPDEGGLLLHGVVTDISERKRADQQREQHLRSQAQKLESLAVMAGVLAHDFNNLITGILGHVSLTRLTASPDQQIQAGLGQVESISLKAAELCRQLSTVAGKNLAATNARNLNALARDAGEQAQRTLPERVRLRLGLSDQVPNMSADESQIRVLINHLLANAVEAIGTGAGEILIRTLPPSSSTIELPGDADSVCFDWSSAELKRAAACLEVRDTGPGIAPEVQSRLFDPFFTTKPGYRGLGLSTVLGIVRAHKGGIQVHSAPGRGTSVRVYLPVAAASKTSETIAENTKDAFPGSVIKDLALRSDWVGHGTILLVDDESAVRDVASRLLRSLGFLTIEAADGEEALRLFEESSEKIRLALIDLSMPRKSGDETARELRRKSADLPLVLMSGYSEGEVKALMPDVVMAGYLQKPFRLPTLMKLLQQLLPA